MPCANKKPADGWHTGRCGLPGFCSSILKLKTIRLLANDKNPRITTKQHPKICFSEHFRQEKAMHEQNPDSDLISSVLFYSLMWVWWAGPFSFQRDRERKKEKEKERDSFVSWSNFHKLCVCGGKNTKKCRSTICSLNNSRAEGKKTFFPCKWADSTACSQHGGTFIISHLFILFDYPHCNDTYCIWLEMGKVSCLGETINTNENRVLFLVTTNWSCLHTIKNSSWSDDAPLSLFMEHGVWRHCLLWWHVWDSKLPSSAVTLLMEL